MMINQCRDVRTASAAVDCDSDDDVTYDDVMAIMII